MSEKIKDFKVDKRRVARVVIFAAAIGVPSGYGYGYLGDSLGDSNYAGDVAYAEGRLEEFDSNSLIIDTNQAVLAERYGSFCFEAASLYVGNGPLAHVDEDQIIPDLIQEPGEPCGESPSAIRLAWPMIVETVGSQEYNEGLDRDELQESIVFWQAEAAREKAEDKRFSGETIGVLVMPFVTLIFGGLASIYNQRAEERKRRLQELAKV